jgi:tRNA-dihydrouridine synthase
MVIRWRSFHVLVSIIICICHDLSSTEMLGTTEYIDETDGTTIFSTSPEEKDRVILQIGTSDPDRAVQVLKMV